MNRAPSLSAESSRAILLAMWTIAAIVLIALNWSLITALNFRDPDDALRLVQVRDLLAGQSWFDLTQHRIFPPEGVPMHWSRLVDLPIALMLALLDPLLGAPLAERITLVAIPLGWLLVLSLLVYKIARWMEQSHVMALLCVFLLLTSVSIMIQFTPMRIDHHGIQLVCGAVAVMALVRMDRRDGRLGLLAGIAMACWMQISLEGLPYAVTAGGIFALRHIARTDRKADLRAYMLALTGGSAVLLFATRAPADALRPWCDSFSPSYLVPLGITTLTLLAAQGRLRCPTRTARILPLALAGGAGIATFLLTARQCLAGPFDTLDPLVYKLWYLGVQEGLPITMQSPEMRMIIVVPALLGLVGSGLALHRAPHDRARSAWATLLILQIASLVIALSVMRAMAFAHLVALPGNAVLLAALIRIAQRFKAMPLRVCLTAATVIATPSGAAVSAAATLGDGGHVPSDEKKADSIPARYSCTTPRALKGLAALPATTLFTPLDIGAHMLVYTHHSVIATGHHRNGAGMKVALEGLTTPPDTARGIVTGSGARYLAFCAGENEVARYSRLYPQGLMAVLAAGHTPDWLEPVPMRSGETIKVYRIVSRTADTTS
ncbi:MAG: hypothetical protein BGP16_09195 [Sphingobium sp. 66-54]|nr:MAG: hypothetical protein BGP16_09195 [Sphingobium sp. 66-54]